MEVISVILMFVFGNMNDQSNQMTQYIPMKSLSSCMKEVRLMKKKNNPVAKELYTPQYKPKVVKSKKIYDRKNDESIG